MNRFLILFSLIAFSSYGANVALPNLPMAIPSTNDTITGVKGGIASQFLLKNIIALNTNKAITVSPATGLISPIQTALNNIPSGGPSWGTNVTGALINLAPGDYYVSNTLFYSNTFAAGIHIKGSGKLNTRIIYAGNVRTNLLRICGGGNSNPFALNLPLDIEIEDLTFTSLTNDLIELIVLTNFSSGYVKNINIENWMLITNNLHGPQLSIDGPPPPVPPGNVGLVIGSQNDHACFIEDCYFAGLACNIHSYTDHLYLRGIKTAMTGVYDDTVIDGTAWPNTSPYFHGPVVLLSGGLDANITDIHFYVCNTGIMNDGGPNINLTRPLWEGADHALATFDTNKIFFITEGAISDDIVKYKINHGPYSLTASPNIDVRYAIWSKIPSGMHLNGNGAKGTNFSLLSGDHITGAVIDAQSPMADTNHIYVLGSSLTSANGVYTWKSASAALVFWTNTTGCGIILDRTGGSISINDTDAYEITNSSGHIYGKDTVEVTIGGALFSPIPTGSWELVGVGTGTPPSSAKWGTNYVTSISASPYLTGGQLFYSQAASTIPPQLPINSVWVWNSNGILYGIQTSNKLDTTTQRYTNKFW